MPALVGVVSAVAVVGFFPGYFRQFPRFANSGWEVHFHLATIIAWLAMLVTQGWLAASGRLALHRRVGRWFYVLVPLLVVGWVLVTRFGQQRHPNPALIGASVLDGSVFLTFYVLALKRRKTPALHGRYMLLTAVAFVDPALGRAIDPRVALPVELAMIVAILVAGRRSTGPSRGSAS